MDSARIAALLGPFLDRSLAPAQLDQISTYIDLLLRWNARTNLTAIRNPDQIVTRHFGESFFLARHLFFFSNPCHPERSRLLGGAKQSADRGPHRARLWRDGVEESKDPCTFSSPAPLQGVLPGFSPGSKLGFRVLDLGSGAGFPGLPLKIWAPHIHLTLIESNHKKAAFLREVVRALTLTSVNVIAERAEAVAARLARAVSPVPGNLSAPERRPGFAGSSGDASTRGSIACEHVRDRADSVGEPNVAALPEVGFRDHAARKADVAGPADIVTFRAVEKFDQILPLAASFLAPNGLLALLSSSAQLPLPSFARMRGAAATPSAVDWETICVPQSRTRVLAIGSQRRPS